MNISTTSITSKKECLPKKGRTARSTRDNLSPRKYGPSSVTTLYFLLSHASFSRVVAMCSFCFSRSWHLRNPKKKRMGGRIKSRNKEKSKNKKQQYNDNNNITVQITNIELGDDLSATCFQI